MYVDLHGIHSDSYLLFDRWQLCSCNPQLLFYLVLCKCLAYPALQGSFIKLSLASIDLQFYHSYPNQPRNLFKIYNIANPQLHYFFQLVHVSPLLSLLTWAEFGLQFALASSYSSLETPSPLMDSSVVLNKHWCILTIFRLTGLSN